MSATENRRPSRAEQLLAGCWFSHADRVRERDDRGRLTLVCPNCGDVQIVLPGQKFKARKVKAPKKRKSADVLTIAARKQA